MQIIVLGAGRAGTALIHRLYSTGHDVIAIASDMPQRESSLPDDIIKITGVIFDVGVLEEAGIESADAVCAVSDNQNQNIMASRIAQEHYHVPKVIARVFETYELHVFDGDGFVSISSPELTVDAFIEELQNPEQKVQTESCICDIMGNAVQFCVIDIDDDLVGSRISEIEDTQERHVFGILRRNRLILSLPDMKLEEADRLLLAD